MSELAPVVDTSVFSPLVRNLKVPMPDWAYHEERDEEGRYIKGSGCGLLRMELPGMWDMVVERLGPQRAFEGTMARCKCDEDARSKAHAAFVWSKLPDSSATRSVKTFPNFEQRNGTDEAYAAAKALVTVAPTLPPPMLVLSSKGTGTGKSHLAEAICRLYLASKRPVRYERVPSLMRALQPPDTGAVDRRTMTRSDCLAAFVLWLDELGGEKPSAFTESELLNIIDTRMMRSQITIITTNKMPAWFDEVGYERIGSRLFGENTGATRAVIIPDTVTDYRTQNLSPE